MVLAAAGGWLTVATITAGTQQTTSLIEWFIAALKSRRGAVRRGGIFAIIGELLGTMAALVCFVVAAFAVGFVLGMVVAGIALLLLDLKVALLRRARAAGRR